MPGSGGCGNGQDQTKPLPPWSSRSSCCKRWCQSSAILPSQPLQGAQNLPVPSAATGSTWSRPPSSPAELSHPPPPRCPCSYPAPTRSHREQVHTCVWPHPSPAQNLPVAPSHSGKSRSPGDFHGDPVVKASPSNAEGAGLFPGRSLVWELRSHMAHSQKPKT